MLVYVSYEPISHLERPEWVTRLADILPTGWAVYDPWSTFSEQAKDPLFMAILEKQQPSARAQAHPGAYNITEHGYFEPVDKMLQQLASTDMGPNTGQCFRELYMLMRCGAFVGEFDQGTGRDGVQMAMYAHLWNIPVIILSSRFMLSPWLVRSASVLMESRNFEDILRQLIAFSPQLPSLAELTKPKEKPKPKRTPRKKTPFRGKPRRKPSS